MAITVRELYHHAPGHYRMRLKAGRAGLGHLVRWVHTVEDITEASLLQEQEAVLTSCALSRGDNWLLEFTKRLIRADASALFLVLGPRLPVVPEKVSSFCEQMKLPLFVFPETVCASDISRDFCQTIVHASGEEQQTAAAMKCLVRGIGSREEQVQRLTASGFGGKNTLTFVCTRLALTDEEEKKLPKEEKILSIAEQTAKGIHENYLSFHYEDCLISVLKDYTDEERERFLDLFQRKLESVHLLEGVHIGVGDPQVGTCQAEKAFNCAFEACELAEKKGLTLLRYREMGAYKLLIDVRDKSVLQEYYSDTLGKLDEYDAEHSTDFHHFLKVYLECSASPQKVSQKMFIHRNTVSNYLKRVEAITGSNLDTLEDKVRTYIAYYIADIL